MANEHPFQHLFEALGRTPIAHAEAVNRKAYQNLSDILSVAVEKSGRCILLRAPRAGHGKTHLLARIQHQLGATHQFVPLTASMGSRIDASSVIDDTLRCLVKQLPASGGLSVLDLVTRRLFAAALQPLVGSGEVPCLDREGALAALRLRPVETFDFHHPNAVTAHWAQENFEVLGQRLSLELAQRGGLPVREVAFWVDILFRFASAPLDHSGRVSGLAEAVHQGSCGEMERLEALLGLVTQLTRVVLVADDLEGFSSHESAALKFAAFLGTLRQSVERLDVILSLNQDIWESAFLPRLSGGLADRLSEVVVELEPLKESEMAELLDSRVPGLGNRVLERIDVASSGRHARGLIRAAGMAWLKATAADQERVAEPVRAPVIFQTSQTPVVPDPLPVIEEPVAKVQAPESTPSNHGPTLSDIESTWPVPEFSPPPAVSLEATDPNGQSSGEETENPFGFLQPEKASNPASPSSFNASPPATPPNEVNESAVVDSPFLAMVAPQPPLVEVASQPDPEPQHEEFQPPAAIPQEETQSAPAQEVVKVFQTPDSDSQAQVESRFQAAPEGYVPAAVVPQFQSAPTAPATVTPVAEATTPPPDTDRVDDLLRQFRERYGRGSL